MHALDILGDPTRRRILELLADGEQSAGDLVDVLSFELGITQPAVSQHLKILRENGFARVRIDAQKRIYSIEAAPLQDVDQWLSRFRRFWENKLDALGDEINRGKKSRQDKKP
jgi:DNA-binding transcriptional ArsR family regulator